MKISRFVNIFATFALIYLISFGCTTMEVHAPKGSVDVKEDEKLSSSSEIQGDYLLTSWQESAEESFDIDFTSEENASIVETVTGALGLKRYDVIAFIANDLEILGYIPALGILEYKKSQENLDVTSMDDFLDKSWQKVLTISSEKTIRSVTAMRIPSTKTISLFIAFETGEFSKLVISDATQFLNVSDYGVKKIEISESVQLTSIANDQINAVLPVFSKESVFVLLFSGTLLKVDINTLEVNERFEDILWNGYALTTRLTETGLELIAAGRHPEKQIIIYKWNELNEFVELKRLATKGFSSIRAIFGKDKIFVINADDRLLISNAEFTWVKKLDASLGHKLYTVEVTDDMTRMFISTELGTFILGTMFVNDDYMISSQKLDITSFVPDAKALKLPLFGKFINNSYLLVVFDKKAKLIRTKFDKQIEGAFEIVQGAPAEASEDDVPSYKNIKTYKQLLDTIEQNGDWEAMKEVYVSIEKDFEPSGTYFPGFAGTAMRGGWIEDTLADQISKREKIAALIMQNWDAEKKDLLFANSVTLLRKDFLPVPEYLALKQPLIALQRAYILKLIEPQAMVEAFDEFLRLWGESFEKGKKNFKNLNISEEEIADMKLILLNLGFELFDYLPAPIRTYQSQLLETLENSEFLSDVDGLQDLIQEKKADYEAKWSSGR